MQSSSTQSDSLGASAAGGFFEPFLPSPAPSSAMSMSTATPSTLPSQRAHPLKSGSMKETAVISHIDNQILKVNRRHAKKFSSAIGGDQPEEERGYESFKEVVKDLETIINVVWVSGTPSLQIPYLISLAGLTNTYLPDYPFSPQATFRILKKLDISFASLILGEDVETGVPLSGFESRRQVVSMTEKVRIKSIAEMGRLVIVEVKDRADDLYDEGEDEDEMDLDSPRIHRNLDEIDDDSDDDLAEVFAVDRYPGAPGKWEMEVAKTYQRTIELLGGELGKCELIS